MASSFPSPLEFLAPSAINTWRSGVELRSPSIHTQRQLNPLPTVSERSRAEPLPSSSSRPFVRPLHGSSGYLQGAGDRWEPRRARPRRQGRQRLPEEGGARVGLRQERGRPGAPGLRAGRCDRRRRREPRQVLGPAPHHRRLRPAGRRPQAGRRTGERHHRCRLRAGPEGVVPPDRARGRRQAPRRLIGDDDGQDGRPALRLYHSLRLGSTILIIISSVLVL